MDGPINPNKAGFTEAIDPSTNPASAYPPQQQISPEAKAIADQYLANLNTGALAGKTFN